MKMLKHIYQTNIFDDIASHSNDLTWFYLFLTLIIYLVVVIAPRIGVMANNLIKDGHGSPRSTILRLIVKYISRSNQRGYEFSLLGGAAVIDFLIPSLIFAHAMFGSFPVIFLFQLGDIFSWSGMFQGITTYNLVHVLLCSVIYARVRRQLPRRKMMIFWNLTAFITLLISIVSCILISAIATQLLSNVGVVFMAGSSPLDRMSLQSAQMLVYNPLNILIYWCCTIVFPYGFLYVFACFDFKMKK